ncbi:MAG: glycosyltransferase family 39 protein [Spirochaetales bacterium]|nr:glycosyltransferase family 39 protein [Spirochaetales bacterium]
MRRSVVFLWICVLGLSSLLSLYAGENLIKNPSFEKDHNGWASHWFTRSYLEGEEDVSYSLETGEAHTGERFISASTDKSNDVRIYQIVEVKPKTVYRLSAWVKAENVRGGVGVNISVPDSFAASPGVKDTQRNWQEVVLYGMTGKYQTRLPVTLRIGGWAGFSSGKAEFDDVSMTEVTERPFGKNIESLSFSDDVDDTMIQDHFTRINNIHYTTKKLTISIFFAILTFVVSIFFSLYLFVIKGKNSVIDKTLQFAAEKLYYIFIAILFIVFYIVFIHNFREIGMDDVQLSFLIMAMLAGGTAAYLFKIKQLTPGNIAKILIILGITVRICYFMYTDTMERQHDIWGAWNHVEYMKHIAATFTLPSVGTYETYHPPVHYFLSAIPFNIARFFGLSEDSGIRAVELLMVFFSSLTLIFIYKILNRLKIDKKIVLIGTALACFHPGLIYMSIYLNNDVTVGLFYIITFYYLIKWVDEKTLKNVILLAVFTALSLLSKKSAMVILPVQGIVFIKEMVKNKQDWKKYLKHGLIFLGIALPLGFSYMIRNYLLFQHDLSYAIPPLGTIMPNNPFNLFFVSIEELFRQPYVSDAPHENVFFLTMLFRTSLFSVFQFKGLEDLAIVMIALYLVLTGVLSLNFILFRKKHMKDKGYIFLLNFVSTLVIYFRMRLYSPYDCTQAFRYISPFIMISLCYFAGSSIERFSKTKYPVLNVLLKAHFWLFCLFSAFFILSIGFSW